jgi:hypothetical protein
MRSAKGLGQVWRGFHGAGWILQGNMWGLQCPTSPWLACGQLHRHSTSRRLHMCPAEGMGQVWGYVHGAGWLLQGHMWAVQPTTSSYLHGCGATWWLHMCPAEGLGQVQRGMDTTRGLLHGHMWALQQCSYIQSCIQ